MGNRKITKVTPAMKWGRKRWATKGRLRSVSAVLQDIIASEILTIREKRSLKTIIKRLSTIDQCYSASGPESKERWLLAERIAANKKWLINKRNVKNENNT